VKTDTTAFVQRRMDGARRLVRCRWCGKDRREFSGWEQQHLKTNDYSPLCLRCASKRLNNPFNALLPMRKIGEPNLQPCANATMPTSRRNDGACRT
jgi:hypothetical protein